MPELNSPWREILTFLIGGGLFTLLDRLIAYRRQKSELRLAGEQAAGESLERRVTATVKVIDIYQESHEDFAERIRGLRTENRRLQRDNETWRGRAEKAERWLLEEELKKRLAPPSE